MNMMYVYATIAAIVLVAIAVSLIVFFSTRKKESYVLPALNNNTNYTKFPADCRVKNLGGHIKTSAKVMADLCNMIPSCKGFSHNETTNDGVLKAEDIYSCRNLDIDTSSNSAKFNGKFGYNYYAKKNKDNCSVTNGKLVCDYGKVFPGECRASLNIGESTNYHGKSLEEMKKLCDAHPECKGFSFRTFENPQGVVVNMGGLKKESVKKCNGQRFRHNPNAWWLPAGAPFTDYHGYKHYSKRNHDNCRVENNVMRCN